MKNILIDLLAVQAQENKKTVYHGGGEYARTIFYYILEKNTCDNISVIIKKNLGIFDDITKLCKKNNIRIYEVEDATDINSVIEREKIDVFFISILNSIFSANIANNVKLIYTCHDIRFLELEYENDNTIQFYFSNNILNSIKWKMKKVFSYFYLKHIKKTRQKIKILNGSFLNRANKIITVSNYSKQSIMNQYPNLDDKKIEVCYSPSKMINGKESNIKEKEKIFLLISTNRYVKNAYRAIISLDHIFTKNKLSDYRVICTGNTPVNIRKRLKNINRFQFLGYVSEEELENLYAIATVFIYPTLYEGFGYPPIEAMKYGTLVVASNVTSVPEVCGDAAIYFNPYDCDDIEGKILMTIKEDRLTYEKKCIDRYGEIKKIQNQSLKKIRDLIIDRN